MDYKAQIIEEIDDLNEEQQREILDAVLRVKQQQRPKGEPGWRAIQHAREIGFSAEDLAEMQAAIEEAFEVIDDFPDVNLDE